MKKQLADSVTSGDVSAQLKLVEDALLSLQQRTVARIMRGVEGGSFSSRENAIAMSYIEEALTLVQQIKGIKIWHETK